MSAGPRIDVWDGWRGIAILLVLIGHFAFTQWVWEERLGVDVFFVLSGMLMSNILFIDRLGLRDFYIRRFSRVVPTLLVFLCASLLISILLNYDFKLSEFVASAFFIRTYFPAEPVYFSTSLPTGHLWSLNVEEHSYVLMSIMSLVLIARGKIALALFSIYCVSVVLNFLNYIALPEKEFYFSLIRTESAIGFIAFSAAYNLFKKDRSFSLPAYLPLVLLVITFLCYLEIAPVWLTFCFGPIFLGIAVNHLVDCAKPIQQLLTFAPLRWFGMLSYSMYLWQQIFYKLFYALPGKAFTGFVLSVVVGACSFYFFENPVRRYINQRWSPNPQYRQAAKSA